MYICAVCTVDLKSECAELVHISAVWLLRSGELQKG